MAGLPKKYAKMGFKKGWAAYRGSKRRKSSPKVQRKVKRMARRRYSGRRRGGRRSSKKLSILAGLATVVFVKSAMDTYKAGGADGMKYLPANVLLNLTGYNYITNTMDKSKLIVPALFIGSTLAPKIPIVSSVPRKIPIVGKFLKW